MKKLVIVVCCFAFNLSAAELSCSRSGLKILYINGILTSKYDPQITARKITVTVQNILSEIDQKSLVEVEPVYNESGGFFSDLFELKAGVEEFVLGANNQYNFWRKLAQQEVDVYDIEKFVSGEAVVPLDKKVEEAFNQIYGKSYRINPKTKIVDTKIITDTTLTAVLNVYSDRLQSRLNEAQASENVVEALKSKITTAHGKGKSKVIVVAHSQGNVILENALNRIYTDYWNAFPTPYGLSVERSWFETTVGFVHLASPIKIYENLRKKYILTDVDHVIDNSYYVTRVKPSPANYYVNDEEVVSTYSFMQQAKALAQLISMGHSVDNDYLSESVMANGNNRVASLAEHFRNTIKDVAQHLDENCRVGFKVDSAICSSEYSDGASRATGEIEGLRILSDSNQRVKGGIGNGCSLNEFSDGYYQDRHIFSCSPVQKSASVVNINFKAIGDDSFTASISNPCFKGRLLTNGSTIKL